MHKGRIWGLDVFENEENELRVLSGDNDNGLIMWQDCTLEVETELTLQNQVNSTLLDKLTILKNENNFKEAARLAFSNDMYIRFLETISQWRRSAMHSTEMIYYFEDIQQKSNEVQGQHFELELTNLFVELFESNKKKVLLFLKNFVTHSKYSSVVHFLLKTLLSKLRLENVPEFYEELRNESIDLQQLLEIYKIFTERYFSVFKRNLKTTHSLALFVEKNNEILG